VKIIPVNSKNDEHKENSSFTMINNKLPGEVTLNN